MAEDLLAEVTQVAVAGGATLVTAMATDLWTEIRKRLPLMLSRGDRRVEALQRQLLDESHQAVAEAGESGRRMAAERERHRWETSLRQALVCHPDLALELALLLQDLCDRLPTADQRRHEASFHAVAQFGSVVNQAGRDIRHPYRGQVR